MDIQPRFDDLIDLLLIEVPEFQATFERLDADDRASTFYIFEVALPEFLLHETTKDTHAEGSEAHPSTVIDRTVRFIEAAYAEAKESEVQDVIVVGFLAKLDTLRLRGSDLWEYLPPRLEEAWERYVELLSSG